VKYIVAVQFTRRAATAEDAGHMQEAIEHTSSAISSLRDAINAYASVARNQSDRGAIAVAVEYGYRELEKRLSELKQKAAGSGVQKHK